MQLYLHPLREIADQHSFITHKDLNLIFSNVEVLLPIHEQLLQELLECAATRDEEFCIGECFLKIIPFLKLYIDYENANHRSTITLNHCMANSRQLRSILRVREAASPFTCSHHHAHSYCRPRWSLSLWLSETTNAARVAWTRSAVVPHHANPTNPSLCT